MKSKCITRRDLLRAAVSAAALSALPGVSAVGEAQKKKPNILFFCTEHHRFDWLGFNKAIPIRTPNLVGLASRGMRFERVFTPSPLCAPARACIASGRRYERCGVSSNGHDYPLSQQTFYSLLRDSGYYVLGCGKFDLHKASRDWGLDGKHDLKQWGFSDGIDNGGKRDAVGAGRVEPKDPYMAFLEKRGLRKAHVDDYDRRGREGRAATFPTPLPDDAYCDNWLAENGLRLMRQTPASKPWFLQVNFTGAHPPWDITESMTRLYADVVFPQPNGRTKLTPEENVAVRRNFAAMLTNIDRLVGVYLDEVRKRGELDNTIVVYSSDHGEMLGDHGLWGKSVPYQPAVGVPLIVCAPGCKKDAVSSTPVSTMDLAATFLDYAGVAVPGAMDSLSIRPVIEGRKSTHREHIFSALRSWRTVTDGRYKLVCGYGPDNADLLFDLENDPLENANIAEKSTQVVKRLKHALEVESGAK